MALKKYVSLKRVSPIQQDKYFVIKDRIAQYKSTNHNVYLRLPDTFQSHFFFTKKNFEAKLNISSLASFQKKILQILRRARIINKKVFSNEILSPARVL